MSLFAISGWYPPAGSSIYVEVHLLRGKRWFRKRAIGPKPTPPTTRRAPGALGEARAVAPQVGSSVYLASVVCLLCILILISSARDLILVGKRHTPNALWLRMRLRMRGDEQRDNSPYWGQKIPCCLSPPPALAGDIFGELMRGEKRQS